MNILKVYQQFPITPNLQLHMLRAAAVGAWVADHWDGKEKIDKEAIIEQLLLHDTANIIKFDLEKFPHLLGDEQKRITYWKQAQIDFIKQYGNDEHEATKEIAKKLGLTGKALQLILNMGSRHIERTAKEDDMEQKICMYGDLRVGPFGILSINQRFDDIIERYKGRQHDLSDIKNTEQKRQWALLIEQQLEQYVKKPLSTITDKIIEPYLKQMENYDIEVSSSFAAKIEK